MKDVYEHLPPGGRSDRGGKKVETPGEISERLLIVYHILKNSPNWVKVSESEVRLYSHSALTVWLYRHGFEVRRRISTDKNDEKVVISYARYSHSIPNQWVVFE